VTDDPAVLHNDLETLADLARQLHHETWTGTVAEPFAPEVRAVYAQMRARLEAAGYHPKHADWAVTGWILMGGMWSVMRCVDTCDQDGPFPV
jgi:hypothetical protein